MTTEQFKQLCKKHNPVRIVPDELGDGHTIHFDNGKSIAVIPHYWPDEREMDLEYYTEAELAERERNSIKLDYPEGREFMKKSIDGLIEKYKPGGPMDTMLTEFANEIKETGQ